MTAPEVFWPAALGLVFLAAGIFSYRRELRAWNSSGVAALVALGPVLVAASLAAFAGEHFTAARSLAGLVPQWMPARLLIAYFVGVAHLAAATSFVAKRCIRWSSFFLAIMFALFVLLMDLPGAIAHPASRMGWILAAREATFAIGASALLSSQIRDRWAGLSHKMASFAGLWIGFVLVFYGAEHLLHPECSPGVPSPKITAAWVPAPLFLAYLVGAILIGTGLAMFMRRFAGSAGWLAGALMVLLTLALYVPQFFLARSASQRVTAINYVADTLLFAGMLFVVTRALLDSAPKRIAMSPPGA